MDASVDAFHVHIQYQRFVVDYTFFAAVALLVYDYLLTIYLEVVLIWLWPWNSTKVFVLLTRYIPLINAYFFLLHQIGNDMSQASCARTVPAVIWLNVAGILCAECVLVVRAWAVWNRDRIVGIFIIALIVGSGGFVLYSSSMFLQSLTYGPPPYHGYKGCNLIGTHNSLLPVFVTLAASDAAILILMSISAFRAYKVGFNGQLLKIVYRDGIVFYILLLLCSIASVILTHWGPPDLMNSLSPLQASLHSIIASRVIFNIRRVAGRRKSVGSLIGIYSEFQGVGYIWWTP